MRTYDFAPMTRSTVGFDRMFDLINDNAQRSVPESGFPPYDIVRRSPDKYRISLAVAGFGPDEIIITAQQNLLDIAGSKKEAGSKDFIHRGISSQNFDRQFSLADYVEVESASFENGLLHVDLIRKLPEAAQPRRIQINAGGKNGKNGAATS